MAGAGAGVGRDCGGGIAVRSLSTAAGVAAVLGAGFCCCCACCCMRCCFCLALVALAGGVKKNSVRAGPEGSSISSGYRFCMPSTDSTGWGQ